MIRSAQGVVAGTALVVASLMVVACTDPAEWWQSRVETGRGTWEHPSKPWEQWDTDRAECRLVARDEAERDFAIQQQGGVGGDYSRLQPLRTSVDRFEASQRQEQLYERCLSDRGYRRVQRDDRSGSRGPSPAPEAAGR
ncbi:MAG: hypothetical protein P9C36_10985 [Defluviicoccus sp.]|nr:hypothetical protein [Defluviicoccus sp.]MDG4593135.1 hypothetical protein [Defluviicoccus sp.]MDS4010817.1 hypothetical protein [Defluviicoccus sp.]MDS4073817.1 hypothetical protein [Defluviicoccus sp.]